MPTKMKTYGGWHSLSREARLARVMYPNLCEPDIYREVEALAIGEGKTDPLRAKQIAETNYRKLMGRRR